MVFITLLSWLLYKRNLFTTPIRLQPTDYLFIALIGYALLYLFLPIGEVSFVNKTLYFKNILMLGLMYLLGRIMMLESYQVVSILKIILTVTVLFMDLLIPLEQRVELNVLLPFSRTHWA